MKPNLELYVCAQKVFSFLGSHTKKAFSFINILWENFTASHSLRVVFADCLSNRGNTRRISFFSHCILHSCSTLFILDRSNDNYCSDPWLYWGAEAECSVHSVHLQLLVTCVLIFVYFFPGLPAYTISDQILVLLGYSC